MARTYAQICDLAEQILQDTGNSVFSTTELDVFIPDALLEISRYKPRETKETLLTSGTNRELTLDSANKHRLLWIDRLEYPTGYEPKEYHGFTRWGDVLDMEIDVLPEADESVYLYLYKGHILQKEVGTEDLSGALNAAAVAGALSLDLKSLGTGTINEDTHLAITGDSTVYYVTSTVTIAANAATVYIEPKLAAAAAEDAVVTLAVPTSTLDTQLESILAKLIAGRAAISKARNYIGAVTVGGQNTPAELAAWGNGKVAEAMSQLRSIKKARNYQLYSRE